MTLGCSDLSRCLTPGLLGAMLGTITEDLSLRREMGGAMSASLGAAPGSPSLGDVPGARLPGCILWDAILPVWREGC